MCLLKSASGSNFSSSKLGFFFYWNDLQGPTYSATVHLQQDVHGIIYVLNFKTKFISRFGCVMSNSSHENNRMHLEQSIHSSLKQNRLEWGSFNSYIIFFSLLYWRFFL